MDQTHACIVCPHPDQGDHHVPVRWPQSEGLQGQGIDINIIPMFLPHQTLEDEALQFLHQTAS